MYVFAKNPMPESTSETAKCVQSAIDVVVAEEFRTTSVFPNAPEL